MQVKVNADSLLAMLPNASGGKRTARQADGRSVEVCVCVCAEKTQN